jgi:hypothetical protein
VHVLLEAVPHGHAAVLGLGCVSRRGILLLAPLRPHRRRGGIEIRMRSQLVVHDRIVAR